MSRFLFLGLFAAVALATAGCGSMQAADCQLQSSANGPYIIQFTATSAVTPGCETSTPDIFADRWTFSPYEDRLIVAFSRQSTAFLPNPPDSNATLYGKGHFDQAFPEADQNCTVSDMSTMQITPTKSIAFTKMTWLNTALYLGTEFTADVTYTNAGCTRSYSAQALNPYVPCAQTQADADGPNCDPFAQPFASGINSLYKQHCVKDAWATDYTGDPDTGICFFTDPYPSLGGWDPSAP